MTLHAHIARPLRRAPKPDPLLAEVRAMHQALDVMAPLLGILVWVVRSFVPEVPR